MPHILYRYRSIEIYSIGSIEGPLYIDGGAGFATPYRDRGGEINPSITIEYLERGEGVPPPLKRSIYIYMISLWALYREI